MKIITFSKKDPDNYVVRVDNGSMRERISEAKYSKDSIDFSKLIHRTIELWGIKNYNQYTDWAGIIIVETEGTK